MISHRKLRVGMRSGASIPRRPFRGRRSPRPRARCCPRRARRPLRCAHSAAGTVSTSNLSEKNPRHHKQQQIAKGTYRRALAPRVSHGWELRPDLKVRIPQLGRARGGLHGRGCPPARHEDLAVGEHHGGGEAAALRLLRDGGEELVVLLRLRLRLWLLLLLVLTLEL